MTKYVRTDEQQDVLACLEHCAKCLAETECSDGAWEWVILSLHSTLQGAMVCHLSGTAQVGALTSNCARKWAEWQDRDRRGDIECVEDGADDFETKLTGHQMTVSQTPTSYSKDLVHSTGASNPVAAESLKPPAHSKNHSRHCTVYETISLTSVQRVEPLSCS